MIPAFKLVKLADRVLQQLQSNIAAVLNSLGAIEILGGQLVTFTAGSAAVPAGSALNVGHSLGRVPQGVIFLLSKTGTFSGYPLLVVLNSTASVVTLKSNVAVEPRGSFSLWVF